MMELLPRKETAAVERGKQIYCRERTSERTSERAGGEHLRIFQLVSLVSGLLLDTRDVILATLATRYKKFRIGSSQPGSMGCAASGNFHFSFQLRTSDLRNGVHVI